MLGPSWIMCPVTGLSPAPVTPRMQACVLVCQVGMKTPCITGDVGIGAGGRPWVAS